MSQAEIDLDDSRVHALHELMAKHSLAGHWQDRERSPALVPHVWPWSVVRSCLAESGEVIKLGHAEDAANRRTVQLINPALPNIKQTTRTLQMSIQLVNPGETAECHRHMAAALRFVIEGDGTAFTNVDGEKMVMEPNDLILTPHWCWHDHQNAGAKPVVWIDVLDVHLTKYLDAAVTQSYAAAGDKGDNYLDGIAQRVLRDDGYCRQRYGIVRARAEADGRAVPYAYKWRDTLAALQGMAAAGERDPHNGILLDYTNPVTGGPTMPTILCRVQMLAPGESTRAQWHTSSTIYHVIEGEGTTIVGASATGGEAYDWGTRDGFFVPSMKWHRFVNRSKTAPALLFSVSDRPVLESLGLYKEQKA
jgi:gentisate 1,2-dioxygenase